MLITELGYFALLTAFVLALLQVILPTIGVIRNQVAWQRLAPSLAWAQFAAMITSFGALIAGFYLEEDSLGGAFADYVSLNHLAERFNENFLGTLWELYFQFALNTATIGVVGIRASL